MLGLRLSAHAGCRRLRDRARARWQENIGGILRQVTCADILRRSVVCMGG